MSGAVLSHDEILRKVNLFKHIIGLILGIFFGLLRFTGAPAIVSAILVGEATSFAYVTKVLGLDDEDVGRWDILTEGYQGFFVFILSWTIVYNLFLL